MSTPAAKVRHTAWSVGVLLEHGAAPYHFVEGQSRSYYLRLRTQETEQGARRQQQYAEAAVRPLDGRQETRPASREDGGVQILWGAI
jgi:hypothetical protein